MACNTIFEVLTVALVDSSGSAVAQANATTTLVRTGQALQVTTLLDPVPGVYAYVDDGMIGTIRRAGDSLRVTLATGSDTARGTFFVDVPQGCHVHKVSGPDTLHLAS